MAEEQITVMIDSGVLADADADARAAGVSRRGYVEKALRDAHYARLLAQVAPRPAMTTDEERALRGVLAWQRGGIATA